MLKPPKKFLLDNDELHKEKANRISLQDISCKKVCVRLSRVPHDKVNKFSVEENNNSSSHMPELGGILD